MFSSGSQLYQTQTTIEPKVTDADTTDYIWGIKCQNGRMVQVGGRRLPSKLKQRDTVIYEAFLEYFCLQISGVCLCFLFKGKIKDEV